MSVTITATGMPVKAPKKPRKAPAIGKTRARAETRQFPPNGANLSTRAYIQAYHAANASIHLTMPEYACQ